MKISALFCALLRLYELYIPLWASCSIPKSFPDAPSHCKGPIVPNVISWGRLWLPETKKLFKDNQDADCRQRGNGLFLKKPKWQQLNEFLD